MKKNCQLYTAEQLWDEVYNYETKFPKSVWFDKDGYLRWTNFDGSKGEMNPNECAYSINMPLWEVVSVDNEGTDEFAMLFFEG